MTRARHHPLSEAAEERLLEALAGILSQQPFIWQRWEGCDRQVLAKLQKEPPQTMPGGA